MMMMMMMMMVVVVVLMMMLQKMNYKRAKRRVGCRTRTPPG